MKFVNLNEGFHNLFPMNVSGRKKHAQAIFDILQRSYAKIGGLPGEEYESVDAMVMSNKIPMWKVYTAAGVVRAVFLYKDRGGRKLVALGSDGTSEALGVIASRLREDLKGSYMEVSGPLLRFIQKNCADIVDQYTISPEQVAEILGVEPDDIRQVDEFNYERTINGIPLVKRMLGTIGLPIIPK
jgi:hypothetical protein